MTDWITLTEEVRNAALLWHRDGCVLGDCTCDVRYRETAIETWVSARVAQAKAEAWREGYMRGQFPWAHEDETDDPIPPGMSPPRHGKNANPYRAAEFRRAGQQQKEGQ